MGDPPPPAQALNVTGLVGVAWNLTQLNFESRQLLQASMIGQEEDEKAYFVNYVPPSRDTIELPPHVVYILIGVVLVVVATYAIVGHLIKDLMHDLADWVLGPKPSDVESEGGMEEEEEEEERGILYDGRIEKERMENTAGLLPGFYHVAGNYHPPALPLRSIITAFPSERRMSNQNVTLERPLTPHITSLMPIRNHPLISTPMEGVYI